ncbi:UBX domain-containing protein 4-like [Eriocheir sinensis]|uniref:UBX domain-containing protein 4-like n=1 Tax=Eriocheir sinensis TaxID=95602 RepID=UPI0021CAB525|nr:UBX domain-containing protein 4-like [Eriocheir sinensis]XP_050720085.1 UBX domain-containing protein 4-like [Eriocheir sinensis]
MNWFEGSIPEAIAAAKNRKAIFVVYVRDSSEASKTTDDVLSQRDVVEAMDSGRFVAIRLENGTEDTKQFSQIYPLVLVPSLFFISGETGVPLEVLGGPLAADNLKEKVTKLLENAKPSKAANTSSTSPSGSEASKAPEGGGGSSKSQGETAEPCASPHTSSSSSEAGGEEVKQESEGAKAAHEEPLEDQKTPAAEASGGTNNSEEDSSGPSLEDKVERAKVLLAEKQNSSAREKAEEEKQKEIDRRKMGQEMAKKKMQQEQEEIRAAARERRKDKEEDRLARERVKAQIAADRAEKEARAALLRGEASPANPAPAPAASAAAPSPPASSSNISRLKFRLPDGSSSISQFPAEAPLSEVRHYVDQNVVLPFPNYTLASTVQHRPFTASDNSTSLRDLGLVPSAILVILPSAPSSSGRVVSAGGGIWDMLWLLLSPLTFVYGLVQHYLLGRREQSPERTGEPEPKRPREDSPPSTRQRPTTAYGSRGEARFRQQGNIHRLQNDGEDDDENNTWNGNSTQQM